jgi:hypothetical protein
VHFGERTNDMSQDIPPPVPPPQQPHERLDYLAPPYHARRRISWPQFWAGVFFGLAISAVYYLGLGRSLAIFQNSPVGVFGALILKAIAGITLMCFPRWRGLGVGLLTSIAVAGLIFLALCFAALSSL